MDYNFLSGLTQFIQEVDFERQDSKGYTETSEWGQTQREVPKESSTEKN